VGGLPVRHHIDVEWMYRAHELTRKDGAKGIRGGTVGETAKPGRPAERRVIPGAAGETGVYPEDRER
jgi:hypothetical protein